MEDHSKVSIVVCDTYDEETVYDAVCKGVDALGGIGKFVNKDESILVNPNFLKTADAASAVATHPAVLRAVLRLLWDYGCRDTVYGDSPGNGTGAKVADKLEIDRSEPIYGAQFVPMTKEVKTEFPDGMTEKEFYFAEEVVKADAIINVCKMKTHALMLITGAVKNPFGLICGHRKALQHVKYPNASLFARMLVDIHRCVRPRLHIMDGIVAMEGNGPGAGNPRPMKLLLFSTDPVAIDSVFCHLIGVDPAEVPTNFQGDAMGLGTMDKTEIDILLTDESGTHPIDFDEFAEKYSAPDFDIICTKAHPEFKGLKLIDRLSSRPVINKKKCVLCGVCVDHCPVPGKAVTFSDGRNKPPVYDYSKCIGCFCCQELCPQKAIEVGRR